MSNGPVFLQVKVSQAFKDAVEAAADKEDVTISEYVRLKVSSACGYNLKAEQEGRVLGRPRRYKTDLERVKARRQRQNEKDAHQRAVLHALMEKERLDSIEALEAYLKRRGVTVGA